MITKLKFEVQEKQVHVRLFMGPEASHLAMCGSLMFQPAQFEHFKQLLENGKLLTPGSEILLSDAAEGSSSSFPKVRWTPPAGGSGG